MLNPETKKFMALFPGEGLTFDDVSLYTQYADFLPNQTSLRTRFTRNINLNIPFVSAAMDTVTEFEMAVAMAMAGGIGVIHKNLDPERQAEEVRRVKGYLNGLIESPIIFPPEMSVKQVMAERDRLKIKFTGFPIVDQQNKLVGIFTSRDRKYLDDTTKLVSEAMTKTVITAPVDCGLQDAYRIMVKNRVGKLPLVDEKGILHGLYSFHDVNALIGSDEPDEVNRDEDYKLRVAAAVSPYDEERIEQLIRAGVDALVVDTAHGHSKGVIETVKLLKQRNDGIEVIAGNIATSEAAKALLDAGADAIKVGIGPGSICTTRVVCGVGIPQLTAIYNVASAVGDEVPIIADGGIKFSGDVPKAVAVGASSCMMGSVLAGTRESPGEKVLHHGRTYVVYRGMGSVEAMRVGKGSRERYGHDDVSDAGKLVPQGIEGMVELRGSVSQVLTQFVGGLRFSLGYCGARGLGELQATARLVRISGAGLREAHPHDVKIYRDAPNYSTGSN